jgi:hypothetical protein
MINESRRPRTALVPDPSAPTATTSTTPLQRTTTLTITPETALAGIAYHLIDRKLAVDVDEQATRHALCRLKRQRFSATVSRTTWQSMTDPERLQWLLAICDTAYTLRSDNVAVLKRRTR